MAIDLLIENGWVADGESPSLYKASIAIRGDKIACVCADSSRIHGKRTIDASDLCVVPGFIDVHSHADHFLLVDPTMKNKLMQGVTTEIGGNCGSSAYPWNTSHVFHIPGRDAEFSWNSFAEFLEELETRRIAINFGSLVGHNSLRHEVEGRGNSNGCEQLRHMKRLLKKSMEEGAFGLSTGIIQRASRVELLEETAALTSVVARHNGVLSVHLRNEGDEMLEALSEAVLVADRSDVSLQVSHFRTFDRMNWPKQEKALELVERMRLAGLKVNIDCLPYTIGCVPLTVLIDGRAPLNEAAFRELARKPSARAEMGIHMAELFPYPYSYRGVTFPYLTSPRYGALQGMDLYSAAKCEQCDPASLVIDMALAEGLNRYVYYECISKTNKREAIKHACSMVSSDAFPTGIRQYFRNSIIHPRTFGAFPHYLKEFVSKEHLLSLSAAIKKITSLPAKKFGLTGRGIIRAGAWADITIFHPEKLDPGATISDPCKPPSGIEYVLVNGQVVLDHGNFMNIFPGRVLRRAD